MKHLFLLLAFLSCLLANAKNSYSLKSPDGRLEVNIDIDKQIKYSVVHEGDVMIYPSAIAMKLQFGKSFGINPKVAGSKSYAVNQTIQAPVYKRTAIQDQYNELEIRFKDQYSLLFRAYDEGVAYRFVYTGKGNFIVENETADFNFGENRTGYIPYALRKEESPDDPFFTSFENVYNHISVNEFDSEKLAFLPLLIEAPKGKRICITEADLENYPGLFLYNGTGSNTLTAVHAPYPKTQELGGFYNLQYIVKEREPYIAKCSGPRNFPWRVVVVATNDMELLDNDIVYKLASPSRIKDTSWIKPGKVAWDYWNDWNIYGVDFRSGVNNDTYKYFIDFASKYKIEYVILDWGWSVAYADLFQVNPDIDLKELIRYAGDRNVELILWAGYETFDRDMEAVCKHYSEMGIKGFKIDFMDGDSQQIVDFYYRSAATAAKYKLLVDFHGSYKPTGMQRTYPNAVNFEGVNGLEILKGHRPDQVTYDVIIPFIRQIAGPMDYTQGAMRNATKEQFNPVPNNPMSQGTRCRQLAEYVIFESPLNMMCDSPTNYMKEQECTEFIAAVPTIWDNTTALDGKIGEYVAIARQKGADWYIGVLTNWDKRELTLDLSFLGNGSFKAEIFKDGVNADKIAQDYKREIIDIPSDRKLKITMYPGGGYVGRIYKSE